MDIINNKRLVMDSLPNEYRGYRSTSSAALVRKPLTSWNPSTQFRSVAKILRAARAFFVVQQGRLTEKGCSRSPAVSRVAVECDSVRAYNQKLNLMRVQERDKLAQVLLSGIRVRVVPRAVPNVPQFPRCYSDIVMMPSRLSIALVLISTVIPMAARERTLQEQVKKLPCGTKVMVQMKNHNTVVGRFVEATPTDFTLELGNQGGSLSNLPFQDISSIRHIRELPQFVEGIATIPVILFCGIAWIFNKKACDEL